MKLWSLRGYGRRILLVCMCVLILGMAIDLSGVLGTLATSVTDADTNTVRYTFKDETELEDFAMWYAPTLRSATEFPAIAVDSGDLWQLSRNKLMYKKNTAYFMERQELLKGGTAPGTDGSGGIEIPVEDIFDNTGGNTSGGGYGEVTITPGEVLPSPDGSTDKLVNPVTVTPDTLRRQVTYQSAVFADCNYGVILLNAKQYTTFRLELEIRDRTGRTMIGFGAQNHSEKLFPSQKNGGYAVLLDENEKVYLCTPGGTRNLIGTAPAATTQKVVLTLTATTLSVSVNGQRMQDRAVTPVAGHVFLAANGVDTTFGTVTLQDTAASREDVYAFNTISAFEDATMWYMPTATDVPAIRTEYTAHAGNWYVENGTLRFMQDPYMYQKAEALKTGVTLTVDTESATQQITYKTTDSSIHTSCNFAIAMLKTQKYKDFRLEVDVIGNSYNSYIGFGAAGGSWGAHIGQAAGGYAFHTQPSQGNGIAVISGYDPENGGQYTIKNSKAFAYDTEKNHHYSIEVKNGVITATVDGKEDMTVRMLLPMYTGGYIYLASNCPGGGFFNLQITELSPMTTTLPTDISNTTTYTFDKQSDLEAFEYWYQYGANDFEKPSIPVSLEDSTWYIDQQQTLTYKRSAMYVAPVDNVVRVKKQLTINGKTSEYTLECTEGYPTYNANFGIAVLKRPYTNFILDVDLKPSTRHIRIGFGAKGGHYGVFATNEDGGYTIRFNRDGSKDSAFLNFQRYNGSYMSNVATRQLVPFTYSEGSMQHLRLVVSDGIAYYYFNDQQIPFTAQLDKYEGGHLYFALNDTAGGFDNITITDLDQKPITITSLAESGDAPRFDIDRSKDDSVSDIFSVSRDVLDRNGYGYNMPVKWGSTTYRSYRPGEHTFSLASGDTSWHNVSIDASNASGTIIINNILETTYDQTTSRKYYFDHDNDLLDFISQYSQPMEDGETMSGWDGKLLPDKNYDAWTTDSGALTNAAVKSPENVWNPNNRSLISSLLLKDLHPYNYRIEMDYFHASNFWYTYLVMGSQDPSLSYIGVSNNTAQYIGTRSGARALGYPQEQSCGVWAFLEQEGRIHAAGNVYGSHAWQPQTRSFRADQDGSTFMANYPSNRNNRHHMTIEVIDGIAAINVDDSAVYYVPIKTQALGGYIGVANHCNGSIIDNFQITMLDDQGNEVSFNEVEQGFAPDTVDEYTGADILQDNFTWDSSYLQ